MDRSVASLAAVLASLLGVGCAFSDVPLTLPHPTDYELAGGRQREIVVASPFRDGRTIQDRCGMQKNGYNMDTADAVCETDPTLWIAKVLADGLSRAGFRVVEESSRPSALRTEGELLMLFVEPVIGFWSGSLEADLEVHLRLTSATGLVAERTFYAKGWKGGQMFSTRTPFQTALSRATEKLVKDMVSAIVELLDRYPSLGRAAPPRVVVAGR
jgi:hypothetical protein